MRHALPFVLTLASLLGCKADLPGMPGHTGGGTGGGSTVLEPSSPVAPGTDVRMVGSYPGSILLTAREYDAALRVLLGDTAGRGATLPGQVAPDSKLPFDNLFENTVTSAPKVDTFEQIASDATAALMADGPRLAQHLPCVPTSATDRACFADIVTRVGLVALRRPLTGAEVTQLTDTVAAFAQQGNDWKKGVEVFFRLVLQHPDFLFRFEVGTPLDARKTLFVLNEYELASKLAFTLWGEPPSAELLDGAASLATDEGLAATVDLMLDDPRAADQVEQFHAQWLGYSTVGQRTGLDQSLRAEARAMVKRVVFQEDRPWVDLLTLDEAWADTAVAEQYGLSTPVATGAWVKHTDLDRVGLLGTGAFLSANTGFQDASSTKRGYNMRKNVFCEVVGAPPADVADKPLDPPVPTPCDKQLRLTTQLAQAECKGCHQMMNPIGFGFERYTNSGKRREFEAGHTECRLDGEGEAKPYGTFNGPTAFAKLAYASGKFDRCLVQRWVQFTNRRKNDPNIDAITVPALAVFRQDGKLKGFIRRFVTSPSFRLRSALEQ